jgi:predicted O-methyltransferase YrrM
MKLNILSPYESAAMLRLSNPLLELSKIYEVALSKEFDPEADVTVHVPWHTLVEDMDYGKGKHVAMYTHCTPGSEPELFKACERADIVTAMSFTGRQELLNYGVDPKKIWVTPSAADGFFYRRRTILVVGFPQPNGRKRESILLDLAWKYDLSAYQFILVGGGWEDTAKKLHTLGVECKTAVTLDDNVLQTFYHSMDVMLVTGYMEGGSLPILEALSSGLRVLSPRFGYAADYLDEQDLYDTPEELIETLDAMTEQGLKYHQIVRAWKWSDYIAEYALIIGRLTGQSVDLYPNMGMSRYGQLLDVMDEIRPRRICEIGTWNGTQAWRMLQTAGKYYPMKRVEYQGFDLFAEQTAEQFNRELSKVAYPLDVVRKRIEAIGAEIELVPGDTLDTINQIKPADFYFVDGGHSEYTISNDGWAVLWKLDDFGGVAVFDDYYHKGKPDGMGCNLFIDNLPPAFEAIHLPARTLTEDGREIGMVKVCRNTSTAMKTDTARN